MISGRADADVSSISTDTRTISRGQLFVALKGATFDGHDFIEDAVKKGAVGFVAAVDPRLQENAGGNVAGIIVEDTTRSLGDIASGYRSRFDVTVVGVTGSNGKTTTKDMIARVASSRYRTLKSRGTFNNQIGLPLALLDLDSNHEVAVLEMGASRRGDIAYLAGLARPKIGAITNIGPAHYEYFKSIEAVVATKGELLKGLEGEGMAILNGDDELLARAGKEHCGPKLLFGLGQQCDVRAVEVTMLPDGRPRFRIEMQNKEPSDPIVLGTVGYYNIYNALAAACAGSFLSLGLGEIAAALADFEGPPMRMQLSVIGGVTIVNDAYNANPASVKAALRTFAGMRVPGRKIFLMGEMLELGAISESAHRDVGRLVAALGLDGLVTIGPQTAYAVEGCREASHVHAGQASSLEEAVSILEERLAEGDALLIKGSRKNRLEDCLELLRGRL